MLLPLYRWQRCCTGSKEEESSEGEQTCQEGQDWGDRWVWKGMSNCHLPALWACTIVLWKKEYDFENCRLLTSFRHFTSFLTINVLQNKKGKWHVYFEMWQHYQVINDNCLKYVGFCTFDRFLKNCCWKLKRIGSNCVEVDHGCISLIFPRVLHVITFNVKISWIFYFCVQGRAK